MTYECPARYCEAEVCLLLLNAALEGEYGEVQSLLAELTPDEAVRLLPALVTTTASALLLLTPDALATWRAMSRAFLAGIPRTACPE